MSRTYATPAEYASWLGQSDPPEGAALLLRDASLDVDEILLTAVYNVDEDGKPVDQPVVDALRDATCAHADYRDEHGDEIDLMLATEAVSLGPLRFGGTGSTRAGSGESLPWFSPRAYRILKVAGLIPGVITDG